MKTLRLKVKRDAYAWPTQAQGEAVAFRKRYSDGTFTAWIDIALWSPGDKVAEYAYTHHSPSTAALRETLSECEEYFAQRADAEYTTDSSSPHGNVEMKMLVMIRTLLEPMK